jgi:hypothetical protein
MMKNDQWKYPIERFQREIEQHNTGRQWATIANRNHIMLDPGSGWSGRRRVSLFPTGEMQGKRFVGDPTMPMYIVMWNRTVVSEYNSGNGEVITSYNDRMMIDPRNMTITCGRRPGWPGDIKYLNWLLPNRVRISTGKINRHTVYQMWLEGLVEYPILWETGASIRLEPDGAHVECGNRPVITVPDAQSTLQLRRVLKRVRELMESMEAMRASSPNLNDHPVFGHNVTRRKIEEAELGRWLVDKHASYDQDMHRALLGGYTWTPRNRLPRMMHFAKTLVRRELATQPYEK